MQYKSQGWYMIELTTLKEMLQLDDSYERLDNLKRRVIDIAVKQINDHTSYSVSYTQEKQGRVVTHFIFTFSAKEIQFSKIKNLQQKSFKLTRHVTKQQIEKHARPGEEYEDVKERIIRDNLH
jgi:plasmid replication initiation protein